MLISGQKMYSISLKTVYKLSCLYTVLYMAGGKLYFKKKINNHQRLIIPGTTPFVAMALIEMVVNKVCMGREKGKTTI